MPFRRQLALFAVRDEVARGEGAGAVGDPARRPAYLEILLDTVCISYKLFDPFSYFWERERRLALKKKGVPGESSRARRTKKETQLGFFRLDGGATLVGALRLTPDVAQRFGLHLGPAHLLRVST